MSCTRSSTCNAFYYDSSNCHEVNGKLLVETWAGSINVKSVWVSNGKTMVNDKINN